VRPRLHEQGAPQGRSRTSGTCRPFAGPGGQDAWRAGSGVVQCSAAAATECAPHVVRCHRAQWQRGPRHVYSAPVAGRQLMCLAVQVLI
jgi:hypothetical protein